MPMTMSLRRFKRDNRMAYNYIETLKSRKNQVHHIRGGLEKRDYILKIHQNPISFQKELYYLQLLGQDNLSVPSVITASNKEILMSYIGDRTLLDEVVWWEENCLLPSNTRIIQETFLQLLTWLDAFYRITYEATGQWIRLGDIHFRNFVLDSRDIYGIDFEECCLGMKEMDGGRLCAYLLTYNPIFTKCKILYTIQLIELLTDTFNYDKSQLMTYIEKELWGINQRRYNGGEASRIKKIIKVLDNLNSFESKC